MSPCLTSFVSASRGIGNSKVTVLGYGLLTTDARPLVEALSRRKFAVVVADEAHYLKSRNAARTQILVPLLQGAKRVILLTGTPALGRPEEVLSPPPVGSSWHYITNNYTAVFFISISSHWSLQLK